MQCLSARRLYLGMESRGRMHPKVVALLEREQYEQRTEAWYSRRRGLITASDAPAALGVKPFPSFSGCPRSECLKKKVSGSFQGNIFCAHGIRLEDEARDLAAAALGVKIMDVGLLVHPDLPWLGASPDGVTTCGRAVEIKCPMRRAIVPGKQPGHYFPQVQVQMEVMDVESTLWIEYQPVGQDHTFACICIRQGVSLPSIAWGPCRLSPHLAPHLRALGRPRSPGS